MRTARGHMSKALAVLPLTLVVLLVSLSIPVACSAQMMSSECAKTDPVMAAGMPVHAASPHSTGDPVCEHTTANAQAVNPDLQPHFPQTVAAVMVAAPMVPAPAPVATVAPERPAEPPGLVLTVSQLRI